MKPKSKHSQTFKDLRFPFIWMPIITFATSIIINIAQPWLGFEFRIGPELLFLIVLSAIFSIFINCCYIVIPLIIRFLMLKRPMKDQSIKTYLATIFLGVFVRVTLETFNIVKARHSGVPILHFVAIWYVLTAGFYKDEFIYKEPKQDTT